MGTFDEELFDDKGRVVRPILANTKADGSGTWYFLVIGSDGYLQVSTGQ